MTDESDYIGSHLFQDPDDSPFAPKKVKVGFRCDRCGHEWWRVYKAVPADNPPCPKKACVAAALEEEVERRARNLAQMFEEQKAPGHIGASETVKAVDATAEIVMRDHNLTNLNDNLRMGDTMAPKLRPDMQRHADDFFGAGQRAQAKNTVLQKKLKAMGQRAIRGHFAQTAVNPGQVMGDRKPGESALRSLGPDPSNPYGKIAR